MLLRCTTGLQYVILGLMLFNVVTCSDSACTNENYQKCLPKAPGSAFSGPGALSPTSVTNPANLKEQCHISVPSIRSCLQGVRAACGSGPAEQVVSGTILHLLEALKFTCSLEGLTGYMKYGMCFNSEQVVRSTSSCNSRLSEAITTRDLPVCTILQRYRSCLAGSVAASCGEDAAIFLDKVFTMGLKPAVAAVGSNCNINTLLTFGCSSRPCQNEGKCKSVNGQDTCKCKNGYTGSQCETKPENKDVDSKSEKGTNMPTAVLIAIVVGIVCFVVIIIIITGVYIYCTRHRTPTLKPDPNTGAAHHPLSTVSHSEGGGHPPEVPPAPWKQPSAPDLVIDGLRERPPAPQPRDSQQRSSQGHQHHQPQQQPQPHPQQHVGFMPGQGGLVPIPPGTAAVDSSGLEPLEYLKLYTGNNYPDPEYYSEVRDPGADMRLLLDLMKTSSGSHNMSRPAHGPPI